MMEINRECLGLFLFHQTQPRHPDDEENYASRSKESSAKI
jgi:hypothetical protein